MDPPHSRGLLSRPEAAAGPSSRDDRGLQCRLHGQQGASSRWVAPVPSQVPSSDCPRPPSGPRHGPWPWPDGRPVLHQEGPEVTAGSPLPGNPPHWCSWAQTRRSPQLRGRPHLEPGSCRLIPFLRSCDLRPGTSQEPPGVPRGSILYTRAPPTKNSKGEAQSRALGHTRRRTGGQPGRAQWRPSLLGDRVACAGHTWPSGPGRPARPTCTGVAHTPPHCA